MTFWKKVKFSLFGIDNLADLIEITRNNEEKLIWEMGHRVIWTSSQDDTIISSAAEKALNSRIGDCWNMACIVLCAMKAWGWPAYILCAYPSKPKDTNKKWTGHAVCIFQKPDGTAWQSSNDILTSIPDFANRRAIAKSIYKDKLEDYVVFG